MRVYFTNNTLHNKLVNIDDDVYQFLSKFECSAIKKNIYLADDGYYEIIKDLIYKNHLEFNKNITLKSPELFSSMETWIKSEVSVLPTNSIKVDLIVERFKVSNTISFIIERNDDVSTDYFFEIKGKTVDEDEIISFLSQITNVSVN